MAYKIFDLDDIGTVAIYKRRGTRNLRLSVTHDGKIRVSIPTWAPYNAGITYARSKKSWLIEQTAKRKSAPLYNGQSIGKQHVLRFIADNIDSCRSRVTTHGEIIVKHAYDLDAQNPTVQAAAQKACRRALRNEAEQILPSRLRTLAATHDLHYRSFSVRQLKGRWGSCDQNQHITMNLYAMQLPWELLDYVLLHELTHTVHLHHGAEFWHKLTQLDPLSKQHRKALKDFQPVVGNFGS